MTDPRPTIAAFLATEPHGVVSTLHADGSVESALVAVSETPDLHIIFGTFVDSRKFANLTRDPRVAVVISADDRTLQIEGAARVTHGNEERACRERHLAKNPGSEKYAHDPKQRFILVTPTWMRYTDYRTDPDTIEELRF